MKLIRNVLDKITGHLNQISTYSPDYRVNYNQLIQTLLKSHEPDKAMHLAVGGEFEAIGLLEFYLLRSCQLQKDHCVIDVGCGSGRLAVQLASFLEGRYVGIDVVPELIDYAKKITKRADWDFLIAPGLSIPVANNCADFVCFFSVFTHLLHEESYHYLEEAKRVVKPGGYIIFSFLEFAIPSHWKIFLGALTDTDPQKVLTQFLSRDAIAAWANYLDLQIVAIEDGDKPHIPLPQAVRWDNGHEMIERGNLGQSVGILLKN